MAIKVKEPREDEAYVSAKAAYRKMLEQREQTVKAIEDHEPASATLGISKSGEQVDWPAVEDNERELKSLKRDLELLDLAIPEALQEFKDAWKIAYPASLKLANEVMAAERAKIAALILELVEAMKVADRLQLELTAPFKPDAELVGQKYGAAVQSANPEQQYLNRAGLEGWARDVVKKMEG